MDTANLASTRQTDPSGVPGWDETVADRTFYGCTAWLRFVDSDAKGRPGYLRHNDTVLVTHWNHDEAHPDYRTQDTIGTEPRLLLGGRRGYLSGVLGDVADLPALIDAALGATPDAGGHWWWPYLPSDEVVRLVDAGLVEPRHLHLLGGDCTVDLVGDDVDDHIAALPARQRRTNARRERRRFAESGLRLRRTRLSEVWEAAAPLLGQVQGKYGNDVDADYLAYLSAFLRRQADHLDDQAVVFAAYDGEDMVAFSVGYRWGSELAIRIVGMDYHRLRDANEYAQVMIHAPLDYCYTEGLRRLHLGMESYDAKCRRGARVRALWAAVPGVEQDSAVLTKRLGDLMDTLPDSEREMLAAEIDSVRNR
ncbi:GNAT family N-acetyltransferase [Actinokineospora xionganensis]|uniref:GNAT family N-acetyltransferase n=1 Tax=Actinokineospora xionganensis TaxID=2684470 RepID=A0ABR7L0C0_9PSEU|nr:GNAT family N-acetyltransferase [Actinokineospora xionganensis]MBC6446094.1 GNAT family N-acetyltransferase [Actinokineospora xionganensis]